MVIHFYQCHKIFYTRDGVRLQTQFCELDGLVMGWSEMIRVHSPINKLV